MRATRWARWDGCRSTAADTGTWASPGMAVAAARAVASTAQAAQAMVAAATAEASREAAAGSDCRVATRVAAGSEEMAAPQEAARPSRRSGSLHRRNYCTPRKRPRPGGPGSPRGGKFPLSWRSPARDCSSAWCTRSVRTRPLLSARRWASRSTRRAFHATSRLALRPAHLDASRSSPSADEKLAPLAAAAALI